MDQIRSLAKWIPRLLKLLTISAVVMSMKAQLLPPQSYLLICHLLMLKAGCFPDAIKQGFNLFLVFQFIIVVDRATNSGIITEHKSYVGIVLGHTEYRK